jgi:hypothetical protein
MPVPTPIHTIGQDFKSPVGDVNFLRSLFLCRLYRYSQERRVISGCYLNPVMVLVPFLFSRSRRGVLIDHVAKSEHEDGENNEQENERWHNTILYSCIPDQMLARDGYEMAI